MLVICVCRGDLTGHLHCPVHSICCDTSSYWIVYHFSQGTQVGGALLLCISACVAVAVSCIVPLELHI